MGVDGSGEYDDSKSEVRSEAAWTAVAILADKVPTPSTSERSPSTSHAPSNGTRSDKSDKAVKEHISNLQHMLHSVKDLHNESAVWMRNDLIRQLNEAEGQLFKAADLGRDPQANLRDTYRDGGTTVTFGRPAIPVPMGRTVGGTTTINSGTCFRVPESVLTKWEAKGLPVDRNALDDYYKKVEERISVIEVPPHLLGGSSHVIARGAEKLGLAHGPLI